MPVAYKKWFIARTFKEINGSGGEDNESSASRAAHQNSPETRELLGRDRAQVPSNLRRFT